MHLHTYLAFAEELKLAAEGDPPGLGQSIKDKLKGAFGAVAEKVQGGAKKVVATGARASKRARRVVGKARSRAAAAARAPARAAAEEVGATLGRHAEGIGSSMGQGIAKHAPEVGQSIGKGLGEHLSRSGGEALKHTIAAVKEYGRDPHVRAGGAALGTLYLGSKAYGAHKEHQRDQRNERIAKALETLASRK